MPYRPFLHNEQTAKVEKSFCVLYLKPDVNTSVNAVFFFLTVEGIEVFAIGQLALKQKEVQEKKSSHTRFLKQT